MPWEIRLFMKLGIDIDGTIKDTRTAAIQIYNQELGQNLRKEDIKEFHLGPAYGLTDKEGSQMWRKLEHKIYSLGVPLEGAAEILSQLHQEGHQITFITARPGMPHIREVTQEWLKKHGFPFDGSNLRMSAQNKGKVALELGIDLFFEDAPNHLDRLVEAGIPTVIMDAVYNRDYPHDLPRIRSWAEARELIRKLEAK